MMDKTPLDVLRTVWDRLGEKDRQTLLDKIKRYDIVEIEENEENEKICVFCEHYEFRPGSPDYSNMTPGWDMSIGCYKNHWNINTMKDNTDSFRKKILTANTCKDYKFFKEE